ncbi:MAG: protoporphyrinogen oxidase [Chloroflexota bacterium]|nr:protoporphyrinogen oxidase [Chloroflexota bacterium]
MIDPVDVAIVGAGISGLALGYRVSCLEPAARIVVLEASDRAGGKIRTRKVEVDGGELVVEAGPDAWIAQKPWAADLARELGLGDEIIPIGQLDRPTAILRGGRRVPVPKGTAVVAPADPEAAVGSGLLTAAGAADLARDRVADTGHDGDESLQSFVERRFGRETLDWIAEPLAAGIYNADPTRMSTDATFPQYRSLARTENGVIRALRHTAAAKTASGPAFLSLRRGMQSLVDAIADRLGDRLILNASVREVRRTDAGEFHLQVSGLGSVLAREIVVALPSKVAATLLRGVAPDTAARLSDLRASSSGAVSLAVRADQIRRPLGGYGLVIPAREQRPINAVTISSRKFAGRAPEGWTLMRTFFGGYRSPETFALDDEALVAVVLDQLRELIGLAGEPAFVQVDRWPDGSPQYDVGHLARVHAIDESVPEGISLVGSAYRGVGVPDLVRNVNDLAERLARVLPARLQAQSV